MAPARTVSAHRSLARCACAQIKPGGAIPTLGTRTTLHVRLDTLEQDMRRDVLKSDTASVLVRSHRGSCHHLPVGADTAARARSRSWTWSWSRARWAGYTPRWRACWPRSGSSWWSTTPFSWATLRPSTAPSRASCSASTTCVRGPACSLAGAAARGCARLPSLCPLSVVAGGGR